MPALTSITIADGESTPVDHTFVPNGKNGPVVAFKESDGVPVGDNILTVSSSHGGRHKVSVRLKLPVTVTETINGVDTEVIARTAYCRMDFDFADDSTEQERDNAVALCSNLLDASETEMQAVLVSLQDFY